MPPRHQPTTPRAPQTQLERVFGTLQNLTDRVVRNDWNDRVVGRFSRNAKVDEDYEPAKEED